MLKKGSIPWNKGKKDWLSDWHKQRIRETRRDISGENNPAKRPEVREKISKALKGRKMTWGDKINKARKGKPGSMLGKHLSEEAKEKLRIAHTGKKLSEEHKRKISENSSRHRYWLGKKFSQETRKKMSEAKKGDKCHLWRGGISKDLAKYRRKRRRLKSDAKGSHTSIEWENLKIQYNFTCPACKRKEPEIKLTEDHITPLSKGGADYIDNIQPLCRSCNSRKMVNTIKYEPIYISS